MESVYIYGAGQMAINEFNRISQKFKIVGFIVTVKQLENNNFLNTPIYSVTEIKDKEKLIIICSSFFNEIEKTLKDLDFKKYKRIQQLIEEKVITGERTFTESELKNSINISTNKIVEKIIDLAKVEKKEQKEQIIVSLTSFKPRFENLHIVLKSLKNQSIRPFKILLWIDKEEFHELPIKVLNEADENLEIKTCSNTRSYKKLIPALSEYPSYSIVTADDDLYYWPTWLEELVKTSEKYPDDVVAHRIHRINPQKIDIYSSWEHASSSEKTLSPDSLNFPTTGGGVLFPPKTFHNDVSREDIFEKICPTADDIWFYWMLRLNKKKVAGTGHKSGFIQIKSKNSPNLSEINNNQNQNDIQLRKIINFYGKKIFE